MALSRTRQGSFASRRPGANPIFSWFSRQGKALAATWREWLFQTLLIVGLTLWIYWPALRGGFIWDDGWYLVANPLMNGWMGLWKFWYRPGSWVEYYPIQETVQWLQWQMWSKNTLGYHLTNVFLHIVGSLLVWRLLGKLGLGFAWLGGLIFAVHPVQVESVTYISELKNTLSLPFFLLSMCAWIDYEESKAKTDYQKALALYLIAMLCKVSMAPFPAVILLYAWWKRGRIDGRDLKASLPFFLITAVLSFVTVWSGEVYTKAGHGLTGETPLGGLLSRIDAVGLNATVYFARCFLPVDVLYVYPQWPLHPSSPAEYLPWLVMLSVFILLWRKRRGWGRHALLGLGFFLIFLSPFLGFIAASYMNFIWVLDHLLYLPVIGLIALFVAGVQGIHAQISAAARPVLFGVLVILIFLMTSLSHAFAGLFVNEGVFWTYILKRNPTVWLAHDDLGWYFLDQHRYREALVQSEMAVALRPSYWAGHCNVGLALEKLGRPAEAEDEYRTSIKLNPQGLKAYLNLSEILIRNGDFGQAESILRQGLKIAPDDGALCNDLADILVQTGRVSQGLALYRQSLAENPDVAQLRFNFGNALSSSGDLEGAANELQAAVTLDPSFAPAHENLGAALAKLGRLPEAIEQFEAALQINPRLGPVHDNLAFALAQTGHFAEAREQFGLALQVNPADQAALDGRAKLERLELQQNAPAQK